MKTVGKKKEDMQGAGKAMATMAFVALLTAYILAHFVDYVRAHTASEGAQLGFWVWLGFVATSTLTIYIFEDRPKLLYAIFVGYQLVSLIAMGIILALLT
jgi:succinyl-CoA synthetase beta subunit